VVRVVRLETQSTLSTSQEHGILAPGWYATQFCTPAKPATVRVAFDHHSNMMWATWIETTGKAAATATTVAVALVGLGAAARGWYRRTLGRRADRYARLARLGTAAQLSFFESVLGEPPAMRFTRTMPDYREFVQRGDPRFDPALADEAGFQEVRGPWPYTECFFIDRDYYVQTISDSDDTVLAYSVTTRRKRFRPACEWPPRPGWLTRRQFKKEYGAEYPRNFHVRLGKSLFSALEDPNPLGAKPVIKFSMWARGFSYSELHYGGNPGGYQTFVFTASSTAGPAAVGDLGPVNDEIGILASAGGAWPPEGTDTSEGLPALPIAVRRFREETAITTYTVIGKDLTFNYPATFGPQGDEVRTLP
jgi:hypothetical protein